MSSLILRVYCSLVVVWGHPWVLKHSEKWGVGNYLVNFYGSSSLVQIVVFIHAANRNRRVNYHCLQSQRASVLLILWAFDRPEEIRSESESWEGRRQCVKVQISKKTKCSFSNGSVSHYFEYGRSVEAVGGRWTPVLLNPWLRVQQADSYAKQR